MEQFPVPLDRLIAYVKTLHPGGGPLDNVSGAFAVSTQLDEQGDALIGHFVDQARKSGASWSQIGGAMGVSKQAAQKRFVNPEPTVKPDFSRFTLRARNVLGAASQLAGPGGEITAAHLAAALLAEPRGVAAKVVAAAGIAPDQLYAATGAGPATPAADFPAAQLLELDLSPVSRAVLKASLRAALRLGHNYIGTEHMLLGLLYSGEGAAEALGGLGLTAQRAEELVAAEIAQVQAARG
ncbi:MAG TPA: Clp protease N-terminal domain-containing protein [Trebonia sp.]|jgi:hypothetical protein|nr:Clp protease N-terminal domain-containing protein [Trebonia sp.]